MYKTKKIFKLRIDSFFLFFLIFFIVGVIYPAHAESNVILEDIKYKTMPNGKIQIDLLSSSKIPDPSIFSTSNPEKLVFDFAGLKNNVDKNFFQISHGAVDSLIIAQNQMRSRLVINLLSAMSFKQYKKENGLTIVLEPESHLNSLSKKSPLAYKNNHDKNITSIDFRRTMNGVGRTILEFDSEDIIVGIRDELGEIVIDIKGVRIEKKLQRRLDVLDFATAVNYIDTFSTPNGARVVIIPRPGSKFTSLQSGRKFIVEVTLTSDLKNGSTEVAKYSGGVISFDFQNISIRSALQQIAQETDMNFVISDSVSGEMSLRLQNVPWDQALDTIMQTKGLARRVQGNIVWIAPAEEIANQERLALEASRQVSELEALRSDLIQINYAKAEDIANLLKSVRAIQPSSQQSIFGNVSVAEVQTEENRLLSERGSVTVDVRTNSLLVQDTPEKIREILKLIKQLDRPVKQVLIETRIVEANEDFSRSIGAKLGLTGINGNTDLGTLSGSGSLTNTDTIRTDGLNESGDGSLGVNLPASPIGSVSPAAYALTLAKAGTGWGALIDLEISALEAEGNGKIVANPRLLTADKQEAHIEQGQERIFTTNTLGEGTVVTKKAVLGLTVTPQITPDDKVILDVFVTKDSFVSPTEENINTLRVRTQVLLDDGETVVLGGIYEQQTSKSVSKVPIFGDLPIIGNLFKTRGVLDNRRELLIFLTPRIVNPLFGSN